MTLFATRAILGFAPILTVCPSCARPAGPLFPTIDPPIIFPASPDVARLRYIGAISTDQDLSPPVSGWQGFKNAIAGRPDPRAMSAPSGVAVTEEDRLYVTDPPLHCLHLFDLSSRRYSATYTAGPHELAAPADVVTAKNRVYMTDSLRATVDVFSPMCEYIATWANLELTRPVGLACDAGSERLYIADAGRHQCVIVTLDGQVHRRIGARGAEQGQFNFPTFVCVDPLLGVAVADSMNFRIQMFDLEGQPRGMFGRNGDAAGDLSLPKGLAVDAGKYIYVSDAHFENVQVFDPAGRLMMAFGGEGQAPGQFWLPAKLFIDHRRRLWVADSYNRRIQVFQILQEAGT